jgi:hypothetical protein
MTIIDIEGIYGTNTPKPKKLAEGKPGISKTGL